MRIGRSYKQQGITGSFDAIVVGSGIGGLATAALLARHAEKRVLVLERHYTAGGFTHTFTRKKYEWDVGVHYIGEVANPRSLMRRAFDGISDGSLEWADMGEVYDAIVIGGERYDFVKGRERFRARMVEYFPAERAAIDRYLALVAETVKAGKLYFMEKALPPALARLAGPLLRWKLLRRSRQTTLDVLRGLTSNERLIGVLAGQYGDYGLPPSQSSFFVHALVTHHYWGGGAYPVGGSARIAESILPVIEGAGGAVLTSAEVDRILVRNGRAVGVRLADGAEVTAPIVVSDAGVALTFGKLLTRDEAQQAGARPLPASVPASMAHASLYLGLDRTAAELRLQKTNLWVYAHHDHDRNIERYLADPEAPLPVAYLSFPSAKDPSFEARYPGRATVEVVGLAPWERFARWDGSRWGKRGDDYDAEKARLSARLLEPLLAHFPQIAGAIGHQELSTPLSTKNFAAHPRGEIYGIAHTPERFEIPWLRPQTRIQGLFLTGADICTAGIGGALVGGVLAASVIARRNLLAAILKTPAPAPARVTKQAA